MFSKIAILACVLAVANAGAIGVPAVATYAAAPAIANYAAPAVASYPAPSAYSSYPAQAYSSYPAQAYSSYAEPTLSATSENTYRSAGNLHTVSTQSRTISTPFSSSNKHFTKVTNPAVYAQATTYSAAAPLAYAAPAAVAHTTYAAPAPVAAYAAAPVAHTTYAAGPIAHAAPAVAHGASLLGVAYSPAAAVSHFTYSSPIIGYQW